MENNNQFGTVPRWLVFQLTENCNLRCHMCYQWGTSGIYLDKSPKEILKLDPEIIYKTLEDVKDFNPYIGLFGGEPLLYKNIWDIISLVKSRNGEIYMDTNGTTLEAHAEKLINYQPDRLWVSLDGTEEANDQQRGKGVYRKVLRGIRTLSMLKKQRGLKKPEIGITFIVTELNQDVIADLFINKLDSNVIDNISIEFQNFVLEDEWNDYDILLKDKFQQPNGAAFAKGLVRKKSDFDKLDYKKISCQIEEVKSFYLSKGKRFMTSPKDYSVENIHNYFSAQWDKISDSKTFCPLPWKYAEVAANGDVTLCHTFYDNTIGNVYKNNFMDIWNGSKAKDIRNHLKRNMYSICTGCARYHTELSTKA